MDLIGKIIYFLPMSELLSEAQMLKLDVAIPIVYNLDSSKII